MSFLHNRRILIVGVANDRSIATGIARAMHAQGAELAFSYQGDRLQPKVSKVAESVASELVFPCDVSSDAEIDTLFGSLGEHWDRLDGIVHSVGFAPGNELGGDYVESTTREGFLKAHEISAYSFVALAKGGRSLLGDDAALLTMTYHGSQQMVKNYNTMGMAKASLEAMVRYLASALGSVGTRVNAISAGPVRTLASAGVQGFHGMLSHAITRAPLQRNATVEEIGNTAAFLCSPLASGITGETVYVDAGLNTVFMSDEDMTH